MRACPSTPKFRCVSVHLHDFRFTCTTLDSLQMFWQDVKLIFVFSCTLPQQRLRSFWRWVLCWELVFLKLGLCLGSSCRKSHTVGLIRGSLNGENAGLGPQGDRTG